MRLVHVWQLFGGLVCLPLIFVDSSHFQMSTILTIQAKSDIIDYMKTQEFEDATSKPNIKHIEFQFDTPPPSLIDYHYIYNASDAFVTTRPWWIIVDEPRSYDTNHFKVVFERVPISLETVLREIAAIQYPSDCKSKKLHIRRYKNYIEYGNKILEEGWMSKYAFKRGMVFMLAVFNGRGSAGFLDPEYCPLLNLYECAHLLTTNCTIPTICASGNNCLEDENNFDTASERGKLIKPPDEIPDSDRSYSSSLDLVHFGYRGFNDSSPMYIHHDDSIDIFADIFTTAIIHRYNAVFRNLIAEEIHKMRMLSKPHFHAADSCVAIHIRRHDRQLDGVDNMLDWCDKLRNGTCVEAPGAPCRFPEDHACDLNPFGYIQFKHYIHAAASLNPNNKNIFIMTDDGPWVEKHKHNFKHKYNIYSIHGSHRHSNNSVANGVNFFASIEAARQCSGFVGHSRSAIFGLMMKYMCMMHGPVGSRVYGQCPISFDFGIIQRSSNDVLYTSS